MGRLLAVPLAVRFSNAFLIRANLLGGLLSSLLLLLAGRVSVMNRIACTAVVSTAVLQV